MFDVDNPPDTYKKFKRAIIKTIEAEEILSEDEDFETALFIVNRNKEGDIVYADDIWELRQGNVTPEEILYSIFPDKIRKFNSKYFALVMAAAKKFGDDIEDIVILMTGDMNQIEVMVSILDREDYYVELEPWEKESVMNFPDIGAVFRRAITLQG